MIDMDKIRAKVQAWRDAHPGWEKKVTHFPQLDAGDWAYTVVHWLHNFERSLRFGEGCGDDHTKSIAPGDLFFMREYARDATIAQLIVIEKELADFPDPSGEHWLGKSRQRRDVEVSVLELQNVLDTMHDNDKTGRTKVWLDLLENGDLMKLKQVQP